jgi:hypothetical protein
LKKHISILMLHFKRDQILEKLLHTVHFIHEIRIIIIIIIIIIFSFEIGV